MSPFLIFFMWVPVTTSCVLGLVYLLSDETSGRVKVLLCGVFLCATYLQFMTQFSLLGLILQTILAMVLAIWWKLETGA